MKGKLIPKSVDYSIKVLIHMKNKNGIVEVKNLSRELNISYPFLRKILRILNKYGIVKSYKGKNGGFKLIKNIDKIRIIDLIKIFNGNVNLKNCFFKKNLCPDFSKCILRKEIEKIEKYAMERLKRLTLREVWENSYGKISE
jgi:Rrf2 family protein